MKPLILVAAGIVVTDGKILLSQRKPDSHLANLWEFPGGKIETGESPAECLEREFREEMGVEIEVLEPFTFTYYDYEPYRVLLLFSLCRIISGTPSPLDCQTVDWFSPEALRALPMPPADAPIIEALHVRKDEVGI